MKKEWFKNFKRKFKIVIIHPETYEEKGGFNMSKMRFTNVVVLYSLLLIAITTCLIFFTSLRELIPGYTDVTLRRDMYKLERRADSLEIVAHHQDVCINNFKRIISGEDFDDSIKAMTPINISKPNVEKNDDLKSEQDSIFRAQFEAATKYNIYGSPYVNDESLKITFFAPVKGLVTNHFNSNNKHYGVDVVAKTDAVIKAAADGTVLFSDWSAEGGYVIGIQHGNGLMSIYKHSASLLHHEGDIVKAGDAIAIVGGGGSTSTGPHLHFEIWFKGHALNPEDYISFEGK